MIIMYFIYHKQAYSIYNINMLQYSMKLTIVLYLLTLQTKLRIVIILEYKQILMGACQDNPKTLQQLGAQQDQSHLVKHWMSLPTNDKRRTFQQEINRANVTQLMKIYKRSSRVSSKSSNQLGSSTQSDRASNVVDFKPLPNQTVITKNVISHQKQQLDKIGVQAIKDGLVAVFLMSGSQNPMISIDGPLGIYDIGLYSACSIYQILISRLTLLCKMSQCKQDKKIKLYLMTSIDNKNSIKDYFKSKDYFGYGSSNIFFFSQPTEPIVDEHGKIVLKSESNIYLSPRGNGVVYSQIKQKNLISHLVTQGVKFVYFGPINNLLLKIADPCLLGYLIKNNQEVVASAIESKDDCLGYYGLNSNKQIKIYEQRINSANKKWANTCSCYMTLNFLNRIIQNRQFMQQLQNNYHDVVKQAYIFNTYLNAKVTQKCIFFQSFYHEAFKLAQRISIIQIDAISQFAPIRNTGIDRYSLNSAKQILWNWHKMLLTNSGVQFVGQGNVQIHPSLIYDGSNIEEIIKQKGIGNSVKLPFFIS